MSAEASKPTEFGVLQELNELDLWQEPLVRPSSLRDVAAGGDKGVVHVYGTDMSTLPPLPAALTGQQFNDWPDVISTIWNKTISLAGFNPGTDNYDDPSFQAFKGKFATNPFWNGIEFNIQTRESTLRVRDYSGVVNAIIDLVNVGISGDSQQAIINGVKQIAQRLSHTGSGTDKESLAQNSSIIVSNGKIYSLFLYGTIQLTNEQGKWSVRREQTIRVARGYGVLNFGFCGRHADRILSYEGKLLNEWDGMGNADSEPPSTSPGW